MNAVLSPTPCPRCGSKMALDGRKSICIAQCRPARRRTINPAGSPLEAKFLHYWNIHGYVAPVREFKFCPGRKFSLDFAWPEQKVAVECEGRDHKMTQRYASDLTKYNLLVSMGWKLYRCTNGMLDEDPWGFIEMVNKEVTQ